MRSLRRLSLLVLVPAIAACGPILKSGSYGPRGARPASGLTFAWDQPSDRAMGDPRLEGNRFFEDRLHEAIEFQLALRGIHHTDGTPDILVHHHLSLADHDLEIEVTDNSGDARPQVITYEEGTVAIHIEDAKTHASRWVGWAYGDVEPALLSAEAMRSWVDRIVGQMFKDWPVPTTPGR